MKSKDQKTPIYNFGAGPACLPQAVLAKIKADIPEWYEGMSVMEISHRLPVFMELTQTIEKNIRQLLAVPDDFSVLFMQGGARTQFAAIPLNLLAQNPKANYLITGMWSQLARREAEKFGDIHVVATNEDSNADSIPDRASWDILEEAAYFHYADNETIHGIEFHDLPDVPNALLISDMTSNILTKPLDFSRLGLIYASAQKNLGIAGITLVIVRNSLLEQAPFPYTPSTLDYRLFAQSQSLYNTPPVFCWYVLGLMLEWMLQQGGMAHFSDLSQQKSSRLYQCIDNSNLYTSRVPTNNRSRINVPFQFTNPDLMPTFLEAAAQNGLVQLKGHKAVGGLRASLYNAMPLAGVDALIEFMLDFEKKHH